MAQHTHTKAIAAAGLIGFLAAVPTLSADLVAPYDLGYAHAASLRCPSLSMTVEVSEEVRASSEFRAGVEMVISHMAGLSEERVCGMALNLYDADNGKSAKILQKKP